MGFGGTLNSGLGAEHKFEKNDIVNPGTKCQTDFGWDVWQIAFTNRLIARMGEAKVALAYAVVHAEIDQAICLFEYEEEEHMHTPDLCLFRGAQLAQ